MNLISWLTGWMVESTESTELNVRSLSAFCQYRGASIAQKGSGLSNLKTLEIYLKEGSYIPVLQALWSEKDISRKVAWLRAHESELHTPLLYEQAVSEFVSKPTLETIRKISLPLIRAAETRLYQDCKCCKDETIFGGILYSLQEVYFSALGMIAQKCLHIHTGNILMGFADESETAEVMKDIESKIQEVAARSLVIELPVPDWLRHENGMDGYFTALSGQPSQETAMRPKEEWKVIRDAAANEILKGFSKKLVDIASSMP